MTSDSRPPNSDADTASASESENPAIPSPKPKAHAPLTNKDWWPEQIDLSILHAHSSLSNPLGEDFDYATEFAKLDVEALSAAIGDVVARRCGRRRRWQADGSSSLPLVEGEAPHAPPVRRSEGSARWWTVALDVGELQRGDKSVPVRELELGIGSEVIAFVKSTEVSIAKL